MQEATREQENFAQDVATEHDRSGVIHVPGKEYVFVTGEWAKPGKEDEYIVEMAWIVFPDGRHAVALIEHEMFTRSMAEAARQADSAEEQCKLEPEMCRVHADAPAVTPTGLCRDCLDRNYEAEDIMASEGS